VHREGAKHEKHAFGGMFFMFSGWGTTGVRCRREEWHVSIFSVEGNWRRMGKRWKRVKFVYKMKINNECTLYACSLHPPCAYLLLLLVLLEVFDTWCLAFCHVLVLSSASLSWHLHSKVEAHSVFCGGWYVVLVMLWMGGVESG